MKRLRELLLATTAIAAGCASHDRSAPSGPPHPALAIPDGKSHRGGREIAADLEDPAVLAELGRRYRVEKDFERRQEYFLRLLDHFLFSRDRLSGMTRGQVEQVFGPGTPESAAHHRWSWQGGRDRLLLDFHGDLVISAQYAMGY